MAEASISETETKLLKTYNSTEYGVPTTKSAPPKYAWLGATGLASELPSGTITQDGSTYVPQTGRPLQTEQIEAPQPLNAVNAYVREEDTVEWGAISGALRVAEYQQAKHAQELAQNPPGAIPTPGGEGGGCSCTYGKEMSIHVHPGVVDWHERGEGYAGCSAWTSYGTQDGAAGASGEIEIYGHWACQIKVPRLQMQIQLLIFDGEEDKWVGVNTAFEQNWFDCASSSGSGCELPDSASFGCPTAHADYDAWVWVGQYDAAWKVAWWGWGHEGRVLPGCGAAGSSPGPGTP